ncbi:MFS transporter [soil metagenome]
MTPRLATTIMFVVNGAVIGTWIASLPAIQVALGASATEIGLALLCGAAGSLVAMPLTGQLLTRVSSRRLLVVTSLVFPLLAPAPLLAPSTLWLGVVMLAFGAANGAMDVSMNAHGVALESASGRSFFSSLHAGWSIGGIVGALGVGAAVGLGLAPALEAIAIGAAAWVVALLAGRSLGHGSVATGGSTRIRLPARAVLPIGLLAITAAFVEGGLADWAGIYLRSGVGTAAEVAALGYAAFSLGMALGRLGGDATKERVGSVRMLQGGMVLVAVSVTMTLLVGNAVLALIGLVLAGLGVANAIPQLFGAAGRIPPAGPSLSAVFTMAYTAFLLGPPIIGVAADATGVTLALGLTVVAALIVASMASRVPAAETNARFVR